MWNDIGWYGFIGPTTSMTDISLVLTRLLRLVCTYAIYMQKIRLSSDEAINIDVRKDQQRLYEFISKNYFLFHTKTGIAQPYKVTFI